MFILGNRSDLILKNLRRSEEKFAFDMNDRNLIVLTLFFRFDFRQSSRIRKSVFDQMRHRGFSKKKNERSTDPNVNRRIEPKKNRRQKCRAKNQPIRTGR